MILGNEMLSNGAPITPSSYYPLLTPVAVEAPPAPVPYMEPYMPPYTPIETPSYLPPYEDAGVFPLHRPLPPPLVPLTPTRDFILPPSRQRYTPIKSGLRSESRLIVPARRAPYPHPRRYGDDVLIKILTTKNTYHTLKRHGLQTIAFHRVAIDPALKSEIIKEVVNQTVSDIAAIQRGQYQRVLQGEEWQYEAIRQNLVDAATLASVMSELVGIQVWRAKGR